MKVIFLQAFKYKDGAIDIIEVSEEAVEKKKEFNLHDADSIECYVKAGLALLPCMFEMINVDPTEKKKTKKQVG